MYFCYYEKVGNNEPVLLENLPFNIPDSWEWARLSDICNYIHRGKSPIYGTSKKLPIIAQKCNQWDKIYTDRCLFADENTINKYTQEQFILSGDIIINSTGTGTVGRTGYVDKYVFQRFEKFVADSHITVVRTNTLMSAKYLYLFLASSQIQEDIESRCSGSTNQIELATSTISNYLISIPPIQEQIKIVNLCNILIGKIKDKG